MCQNKSPKTTKDLDEVCREFGELSGYVMQLLSKICKHTERAEMANECCRASLKQNPFLWHSFVDLCNRGERPNPKDIFQITNDDLLNQLERQLWSSPSPELHLSNEKNVSIHEQQPPSCVITPNNNVNIVKFEVDVDDTPLNAQMNLTSLVNPPIVNIHDETPYRKQFKYLQSNISPVTPSFGVLPFNSPLDNIKQTTLFLTPSPPLNLHQHQQQQQQLIDCEKNISNKKIRGHLNSLVARKEISTPLQQTKPVVLNQSSNITPTRTQFGQQQQQQDQRNPSVRRSSRIFSNYSVKENSKSPNLNKFAQPRSPPRKASKRVSKSTKTLNELNEKNTMMTEKERSETITSAQLISEMSFAQQTFHIAALKRQSADGLMQLLQALGQAYLHLQHYEMDEALDVLESKVPAHHFTSSWVQSVIALIHHERRAYDEAVKIFTNIHKSEPFRLQYFETYSTDLWHLQKEALLSMLAQDLMQHSKTLAVTWVVAGNCYSALKEHDTAIKFFNRAIQMDPDLPYSYTLLGHEMLATEELEKALGCFRKAILKDPRHYNAWFGIGNIYSKQERFQLAEIHYRHALRINRKNSVILVHIGVMQFYLHKPEQAIQTLSEAIKLEPKNPLSKFHRASMNLSIGKVQDALSELEELKQIVPKESVVYYLVGKIHKQLGNIDLALMHFSWATDLGKLTLSFFLLRLILKILLFSFFL